MKPTLIIIFVIIIIIIIIIIITIIIIIDLCHEVKTRDSRKFGCIPRIQKFRCNFL